MSLAFNDTTTLKGLVQIYEREIGANRGYVSGDANRLLEFTADVNLAFDDFLAIAFKSDGTWQYDDSNHTKYPIITTNLVASQRDYSFTTDEQGNLILDIFRVMVADVTGGAYREIQPIDVQTQKDTVGFYDGNNTEGAPSKYDKTANGIFLDPIPSVNVTNGLKIYINREPSYFTSADTTKKPGCPGIFHRYFAIKPAHDYARQNNLANYATLDRELVSFIGDEVRGIPGSIAKYFSNRAKDERPRILPANHSNK